MNPQIGKTYLLFRNGIHIGEGVYTNDKWNGLCFLELQPDGSNLVYKDIDSIIEKITR